MMDIYQAIAVAAVTGGVSSMVTVAAIKVEIKWLKLVQVELKEQMRLFEKRISALEHE